MRVRRSVRACLRVWSTCHDDADDVFVLGQSHEPRDAGVLQRSQQLRFAQQIALPQVRLPQKDLRRGVSAGRGASEGRRVGTHLSLVHDLERARDAVPPTDGHAHLPERARAQQLPDLELVQQLSWGWGDEEGCGVGRAELEWRCCDALG